MIYPRASELPQIAATLTAGICDASTDVHLAVSRYFEVLAALTEKVDRPTVRQASTSSHSTANADSHVIRKPKRG